jgi:RNA polymerase sigma-70 factor (ECF subfamily)
MSTSIAQIPEPRLEFDRLLGALRPTLHRYCARMTGSVVDGEDVVQEALAKAIEAFPSAGTITHLEGWLFRIAHNAALDFLRRRTRQNATRADQDPDLIVDPVSVADDRQIAAASLRTFMRLPAAQRSSVILMDVLGYSLQEIGGATGSSIAAIKAALHRGRARLRTLAQEPDDQPLPALVESERALLTRYIDRFNARDFDTIRAMLADEVQLDLANRSQLTGRRDVGRYFHNYDKIDGWHLAPGLVERHPAILVHETPDATGSPAYFVLLEWRGERLARIRDFRYARYVMRDTELAQAR